MLLAYRARFILVGVLGRVILIVPVLIALETSAAVFIFLGILGIVALIMLVFIASILIVLGKLILVGLASIVVLTMFAALILAGLASLAFLIALVVLVLVALSSIVLAALGVFRTNFIFIGILAGLFVVIALLVPIALVIVTALLAPIALVSDKLFC